MFGESTMPGKRIAREKLTIKKMIALYESQCPQASAVQGHYEALFAYAQKRLDKCVFGEEKPACKQCPVRCTAISRLNGARCTAISRLNARR
ncbi:hypothetical protein LTSESEN_4458 [Salmonella enterica subsp. enterica serovar Senftenberg str. A4-543]|uniref:Nitrous oxide-stimulated promoter n=1 Tax=Salmonella enterica subsp. enterica serovar Senftenberg str. A4-543 TaxID=913082 RepID=G5R4H0_SALSE|nr:hypothetical protein LTSESEN_4458 [Salmonella enterica subsp. enterica serovar Senftenberg str. A4-543]